jgi:ribosomal protein L12E/L44/L45/RPP1/RPP2
MSATPVDKLSKPELQQLALSYAAFVLGDSGAKVNASTLQAVLDAAGIKVEKAWVTAFGKTLESRPIDSFCTASGGGHAADAGHAAAPATGKDEKKKDDKKEAAKPKEKEAPPPPPPAEDEGVDMGGLFDM